tara:strand:+ start:5670 stop:5846 length:177 start_codon:yes stop_codon:yes gene_type:complete
MGETGWCDQVFGNDIDGTPFHVLWRMDFKIKCFGIWHEKQTWVLSIGMAVNSETASRL